MINGLIPSKPNASTKEGSGTTVLLFYGDGANEVTDNQIIERGYADERGEFRTKVDRSKVGETITCRIRHAAYEFKDDPVLIMPYGAFHTAKMVPDRVYAGAARGADVGDLNAYTAQSVSRGNTYRNEAFEKLRVTGARLSDIPFLYWFRWYSIGIIVFAADYLVFGSHFSDEVTNCIDAIYLSVVTVTTLGYGDIVPKSSLAKLLTSFQAISGVVLVGLFLNSLFSSRN
ncbi:MAG: potassium channel family protein [Pseudomonadota bacterium]